MKRQTLTEAERADWLRLSRTAGVGPITFFQLLARFRTARAALDALPELSAQAGGRRLVPAAAAGVARELEAATRLGARHVAACEAAYPPLLAAIPAPPPVIALRGDPSVAARTAVAVVGARNASAVGCKMARDLARDLGDAGYVVVSGLAGGVDQVYPSEHEGLYASIVAQGCVVSEQPLGHVAQARDFPKRNRIISGLSLAVVVVEAAERSGSLITARAALEQGREVMAVPGSPLDARAKGSNRLIKQGAALVETAEDVLRVLAGTPPPSLSEPAGSTFDDGGESSLPPSVLATVRQALSPTPTAVAEIVRATGAPHRLVLAALAELEMAGVAVTHVGGAASLAV